VVIAPIPLSSPPAPHLPPTPPPPPPHTHTPRAHFVLHPIYSSPPGWPQAAAHLQACVGLNVSLLGSPCPTTAGCLKWGTTLDDAFPPSPEPVLTPGCADVLLCSDCLFFEEFHTHLAFTSLCLLLGAPGTPAEAPDRGPGRRKVRVIARPVCAWLLLPRGHLDLPPMARGALCSVRGTSPPPGVAHWTALWAPCGRWRPGACGPAPCL
jgi:hypothetical protein